MVNASQFSTTEVIARLRDGATGTQVGNTKIFTLAPLSFEQPSLSSAFGSAATGTNLYVEVEQGVVTPTVGGANDAASNGCPTGCPAFLTFGSSLDNQTNDPTTLDSQFYAALNQLQIACIYNPADAQCVLKSGGKTIHRAVKH